jgi:hypothetical protein
MESKVTPEPRQCQHPPLSRLIRAVAHVSQASLLVLQEHRDTVGANKAKSLERVADVLSIIISPLERIGRSMAPVSSTAAEFPAELVQSLCDAAKDSLQVQGGVQ